MNRRIGPWQRSLLATSALSAAFVGASLLWQGGHPEWAFLLAFATVWVTLSISWSDLHFTEQSGVMLAQIVDHNFEHLHDRLAELERELTALRERGETPRRRAS
jgi:hypothetical protein